MLTIAMPVYNQREIVWLAMESLARQETDQEWELLVDEDGDDLLGANWFALWEDRLFRSGCLGIGYRGSAGGRAPLSEKWRRMALEADEKSKAFLLQGADDYSSEKRIQEAYSMIVYHEADAFWRTTGVFVDMPSGLVRDYDHDRLVKRAPGLNIAFRTDLLRNLPEKVVETGVDGWLYEHASLAAESIAVVVDTDPTADGFYTNGFNHISTDRGEKMIQIRDHRPWVPHVGKVEMPEEVARRLVDLLRSKHWPTGWIKRTWEE